MRISRTISSLSALALLTLSLGIQPVYAGDDLVFVAVDPPCRIVDTRATGTPAIPADGTADFLGYGEAGELDSQGGDAGGCPNPRPGSIPVAISANVVAVGGQATGNGNLVAYSFGGSVPDTSLVNYKVDTNIANSSIIGLCQGTCANDFTLKSNFSSVPATVDLQGFLYPKTLQNVITVSAANGDFTNPKDALNSIPTTGLGVPTGDNPYVIEVGPGVYDIIDQLRMRSYVSIIGSGVEATTLRGSFSGGFIVFNGVTGTEMAHMTIFNGGQGTNNSTAIFIDTDDAVTSDPHLHDLKAIAENATNFVNGILIDDDLATGVLAPLIERVDAIAQNGGVAMETGVNFQNCDDTRLEHVNGIGGDRGMFVGTDGDCANPILYSQFSGGSNDVEANDPNVNVTLGHSHLVNGTRILTGVTQICVAVTTPTATLDSDCTDPP